VIVDVIYTQKRQVILEAYPRLHLGNPGYHLLGEIKFSRYPEKFFGIGNDTPERLEELFTSRMFRLAVDALRDLWDGIDAGISTYYETRTLFDLDSHGLLIPATIRGSRGGTTMGLGLIARWDTRDNEFAPLNGRFYQLTWKRSSPKIGSDFDFSYLTADLREFFPLGDESVLGIQALATLVGGEAPFYLLAELGGSNSMRGYYEGRYRDDVSLATQAEYRFPLLARLRGSAFVGIGDVARTLSGFTLRMAKPTYGFGLRYVYDPRARLIIRVDMGFGRGSSGLYVTVHEAF
jgi:outer membrane protein assembly factor BamA